MRVAIIVESHGRQGVSNHWQFDSLFNSLFSRIMKKHQISDLLADYEGNPPVISWFPSQSTSNAKTVSMLSCVVDNKAYLESDIYKGMGPGNNYFCGLVTKHNWTVVLISPCHADRKIKLEFGHLFPVTLRWIVSLIARFMGPTWGPPGADRTQVGPTWATWTLLSGYMLRDLSITYLHLRDPVCCGIAENVLLSSEKKNTLVKRVKCLIYHKANELSAQLVEYECKGLKFGFRNFVISATCCGVFFIKPRSLMSSLPEILISQKCKLNISNHVHVCQVSPQLSCGDTCQIWTWYYASN